MKRDDAAARSRRNDRGFAAVIYRRCVPACGALRPERFTQACRQRPWPVVAHDATVDARRLKYSTRRRGEEYFVSVTELGGRDRPYLTGDAQLAAKFDHRAAGDPLQNAGVGGRHLAVRHDKKV